MRKIFVPLLSALLVACSSGGAGPDVPAGPVQCSNDQQKQFVLDALYDWYLWNDMLPANLSIANFASPEALVYEVTTTSSPSSLQPMYKTWSWTCVITAADSSTRRNCSAIILAASPTTT